MEIRNFDDFVSALCHSGFSMGGGNAKGIFSLLSACAEGKEPDHSPIRWHSEEPETDPWEWRMRVLEERQDIAYSKLFFKTSGYITKEWYPLFLAVRRQGNSFEDIYESGRISYTAKRIYDIICREGEIALHEIKQIGGFKKEDNSAFERALVELQMGMFITMCGRTQKRNKYGMSYGWNSTVFCTVEHFWEERNVELSEKDPQYAYDRIRNQILILNPLAGDKEIDKFIRGK